jgi:hypothetical protein
LTNAQGVDIENMNDGFTRAGAAIQGVVMQIVANLSPAIKGVTETLTNLIAETKSAELGSMVGEKIIDGSMFFARTTDTFVSKSGTLFEYFSKVGGQWNSVWDIAGRTASIFGAVGDTLQAAFGMLILAISGPAQALALAASSLGKNLGFDTSAIDAFTKGADAFNLTIIKGIEDNARSAVGGIKNAFADGAPKAGQAIKGGFEEALIKARDRGALAANTPNQPQAVAPVTVEVKAELSRAAIQGIDSRSTAGATEMFRLMRENPQQEVQNKIEENTRTTATNTRDMGIDIEQVEYAGAAGS